MVSMEADAPLSRPLLQLLVPRLTHHPLDPVPAPVANTNVGVELWDGDDVPDQG